MKRGVRGLAAPLLIILLWWLGAESGVGLGSCRIHRRVLATLADLAARGRTAGPYQNQFAPGYQGSSSGWAGNSGGHPGCRSFRPLPVYLTPPGILETGPP